MTSRADARGRQYVWLAILGMVILFGLVASAERWYGLSGHPSNRYRFHAIPVALSMLYHDRSRDYTGYKEIAI